MQFGHGTRTGLENECGIIFSLLLQPFPALLSGHMWVVIEVSVASSQYHYPSDKAQDWAMRESGS